MKNQKKDEVFAIRCFGNKFCLRGNTVDFAVLNSIFVNGEYDFKIDFIPEYIVDAGAYIGASTIYFHSRFPKSKILAIEPERSNFELLVCNTKPFAGISCIYGGLYCKDTHLVISDKNVEKYAFRVENNVMSEDSVPGYSINTLMNDFHMPRIDILKLDIEGSEFYIFNEANVSWLQNVRVLIIELHEYIHPGVTELFYNRISAIPYKQTSSGENIIIVNEGYTA
jgi:FkbM family methyltransferase